MPDVRTLPGKKLLSPNRFEFNQIFICSARWAASHGCGFRPAEPGNSMLCMIVQFAKIIDRFCNATQIV
jgi:hypothetical protein